MEYGGEPELKPTRFVPVEGAGFKRKEKILKDSIANAHEVLRKHSKEKSAEFLEIEKAARDSIVKLHKEAGLEISSDDLPEVFLVTEEKAKDAMAELGMEYKGNEHGMHLPSLGPVVILESNALLAANTVYHELMHSAGRQIVSFNKHGGMRQVQSGFHTSGKQGRGLLLEEATVQYFSSEFVLKSDIPILEFERKKVTDSIWGPGNYDQAITQATCSKILSDQIGSTYVQGELLVAKLRRDLGFDGLRLLLKARREPSHMKRLTEVVDGKYGKGTMFDIMQTDFAEHSVRSLNDDLFKKLPLK